MDPDTFRTCKPADLLAKNPNGKVNFFSSKSFYNFLKFPPFNIMALLSRKLVLPLANSDGKTFIHFFNKPWCGFSTAVWVFGSGGSPSAPNTPDAPDAPDAPST